MSRGQAPLKILTLHGFLGDPSDFQSVRSQFESKASNKREVSWVDLDLVQIWTKLSSTEKSMSGFARELLRALGQDLETDPETQVVFVGYSMGARLVLQVLLEAANAQADGAALRLWQSIAAAVLVSCHPGLPSASERAVRLEADAVWAARLRNPSLAFQELWKEWSAQPVLKPGRRFSSAEARMQELKFDPERMRRAEKRRDVFGQMLLGLSLGSQTDFRAETAFAERLKSKAIALIAGEDDAKFVALAHSCKTVWPTSRMVLAEQTGHRVLREHPVAVAEVLLELI